MPQYAILEAGIVWKPDFNDLGGLSVEIFAKLNLVSDEINALLKNETDRE